MGNNCLSSDPDAQAFNVASANDLSMRYKPLRTVSSSKIGNVILIKDPATQEELIMRNLVCYDKTKNPKGETRDKVVKAHHLISKYPEQHLPLYLDLSAYASPVQIVTANY